LPPTGIILALHRDNKGIIKGYKKEYKAGIKGSRD
jgi:hypothetical protein